MSIELKTQPPKFSLVCKSYRPDALRVQRLMRSLAEHNPEALPVFIVVPQADQALFRELLHGHHFELLSDEDVVCSHPQAASHHLLQRYQSTPGYVSQQVVKAEAWRLIGCEAYLCMDADTVFLRPCSERNFLATNGHPYTVMHQSSELLQLALQRGHPEVVHHFRTESAQLKTLFDREGPDLDFGPQPLLWSAQVWRDLHERYCVPRGWTLWDAIGLAPSEIRWYGEALLAYDSIPLRPIEPLFRVYHHDWQYFAMRHQGETLATLAEQFLGVVYQSNWEYELDMPGTRSAASRLSRRFKRWRHRWAALR